MVQLLIKVLVDVGELMLLEFSVLEMLMCRMSNLKLRQLLKEGTKSGFRIDKKVLSWVI